MASDLHDRRSRSSDNRGDIQRFRRSLRRLEGVPGQPSNSPLDLAHFGFRISINRPDHHRGEQDGQQPSTLRDASLDPRLSQHHPGVFDSSVRRRHQQLQMVVSAVQAGPLENRTRVQRHCRDDPLARHSDHGDLHEMVAWRLHWKKPDVHRVLHRWLFYPPEAGSRRCLEEQSGLRPATFCHHVIITDTYTPTAFLRKASHFFWI